MVQAPIFKPYIFGKAEKEELDYTGHFVLPGLLTGAACTQLVQSMIRLI